MKIPLEYILTYRVFQEGRSRCNVPPGQCRCLHSGRDETGTRWSLSRSSVQYSLAYTVMTCRWQLNNLPYYYEAPWRLTLLKSVREAHNISTKQCTHVTLVSSHISPAGGTIAAGFVLTVVHLAFAIAPSVVSRTFTVVGIPSVNTVTTMVTEIISLDPWLERFVKKKCFNYSVTTQTKSTSSNVQNI